MTNAIDKQIQSDIEQLTGYSLKTFATRFNDGAYDAIKVMDEIQTKYARYITRDYAYTILGLAKSRFHAYTKNRNATAQTYEQ